MNFFERQLMNMLASWFTHKWILHSVITVACVVSLILAVKAQTTSKKELMKRNPEIKLHYEIYGSGSPVLFLHGFGASSYSWENLIEPLSKNHQLILVDLKGFGKSPKPSGDAYGLQDQADLIYQFILEHDLHDLTLVGHSMGGGVALITATILSKLEPTRLSRLILIDSAGLRQKLPWFITTLRTPVVGWFAVNLLSSERKVRMILKTAYFNREEITEKQVAAYAEPLRSPGSNHVLIMTAKKIIPKNIDEITASYKNILVPTLILWGKKDEIVPLTDDEQRGQGVGERLHKMIPNSQLVVFDECGHIPQEEVPDETIKKISEFLNSKANS